MKEERNCTAEFGPEFFNGERGVTFYTYAGWTHGNGKKFNIATPPLYKILPFPYYVSGVPGKNNGEKMEKTSPVQR